MRALQEPFRLGSRALALVVAMLMITVGLSACTFTPGGDESAKGKVDAKGFSLRLNGVTASASAGVAASGTAVSMTMAKSLSAQSGSYLIKNVGSTVKVSLGNKQQPKKPIVLKFKLDKSKVPAGQNVYAVLSREDGSSKITTTQGTYDKKTGVMTVKTPHLSWFDPVVMSITDFVKQGRHNHQRRLYGKLSRSLEVRDQCQPRGRDLFHLCGRCHHSVPER